MDKKSLNEGLLDYLQRSPTPFHAVDNISRTLEERGFTPLVEADDWKPGPGRYYVVRNGSSIIAFVLGGDHIADGIRMVGAHTDSPCLKVKPRPEQLNHGYVQLGVEVYGGVLLNPWYDRDLSLAGRVTCQTADGDIHNLSVNFERAIATIPSLAIHLDREANDQRSINAQKDIPPVIMQADKEQSLDELLMEQVRSEHPALNVKQILDHELSFFDSNPPACTGFNKEFIAGARLDNLLSCYVGMRALLEADSGVSSLLVCNDHEEVGSASAAGAQGPFLRSVLERIFSGTGEYYRGVANSLLISSDNAHGIHPNYADRHDANHGPLLNKGPVIKVNANQRYASNSETSGYFKSLCDRHKVPWQTFVNRTDMACGSTIGPLTATEIGVRTLDVGVPTFAMHSIRELAGADDAHHLYRALSGFFQEKGRPGAV